MRLAVLSFVTLLLAACASSEDQAERRRVEAEDQAERRRAEAQYVVKYYDRNHDGVVDLEFHDIPGAMDAAWALVDTKFRGRYDSESSGASV